MAATTIAVLSLKGGTGKTTTVRTLTDVFRRVGLDVLAVDLDPQGNLSDYFAVPAEAAPSIADVMTGRASIAEATHDGMVPSNPLLAEAELAMTGKMGRELVLRKALRDARKDHDLILLDCPPTLGLLTVNGLVAADHALFSSEAQYFAIQAVEQALEMVELARDSYAPDLDWLGILVNIADLRTTHSRNAIASLGEHFPGKVFTTAVRASIAYAESAEQAVSILDHRPDLGTDYVEVAAELAERLGMTDLPAKIRQLAG